jgi:hemoglobin-like flavoprotein
MPRPPIDVRLLEESYERALDRDSDFPRLFYDILFHEHPSVEKLFRRNSMDAQRKMFGQTLVAIVDHLDDEPWLKATLEPLGHGHVAYGVTPEMYDVMADALIRALSEVNGADWRPEHHTAWAAAFDYIVALMRAGEPGGGADPAKQGGGGIT